jgi:O-methyltransferase
VARRCHHLHEVSAEGIGRHISASLGRGFVLEGLPRPDAVRYRADAGDKHYSDDGLRVGVKQVRNNFRRYGLLDDQVEFLVGWFKDTLPSAPIKNLSVVRLDGDMYESTIQAIESTYPKLSVGGFCIVDDYGAVEGCKQAIHDHRNSIGITDEIVDIDGIGVYWRKTDRVASRSC